MREVCIIDQFGFYTGETTTVAPGTPRNPLHVSRPIPAPGPQESGLKPRWIGRWVYQERLDDSAYNNLGHQTPPETSIILTAIDGGNNTSLDLTYTETSEETLITFRGTAQLPDGNFLFPIKRMDTERVAFLAATVADGELTVVGDFPTTGEWMCDEALLNEKSALGNRYLFAGITVRVGRRIV